MTSSFKHTQNKQNKNLNIFAFLRFLLFHEVKNLGHLQVVHHDRYATLDVTVCAILDLAS